VRRHSLGMLGGGWGWLRLFSAWNFFPWGQEKVHGLRGWLSPLQQF
jgi:hypothetical protein